MISRIGSAQRRMAWRGVAWHRLGCRCEPFRILHDQTIRERETPELSQHHELVPPIGLNNKASFFDH
eukprot:COSAG06_NODE_1444_length_9453_cov_2.850438_2_plen_67_part_00